MFFMGDMTIDTYIIIYGNNARKTVCCLVHLHLKDMSWDILQTKWHMYEPISAMMHIESGHIQRLLIKVDVPKAIFSMSSFLKEVVCHLNNERSHLR